MLVGIDATCWSNPRGYGRYARGLLSALLATRLSHDYVFFVDQHTQATWPLPAGAQVVTVATSEAPTIAASANGRRSARDILAMSRAVARLPLDVLFYPTVYTYFPVVTRAKIVLGIHDVIAEEYPHLIFPNYRQRFLWRAKSWMAHHQADYIVAVSEHAREGIIRRFGWNPDRVWVVGEAPDPIFRPITDQAALRPALARQGLAPEARFIICLGGLNPHKNLGILFEALAELHRQTAYADLQLILVGPAEEDSFTPGVAQARQMVAGLGLEGIVRFTGYLPDEEVACLLSAARLLVMPSVNEGFGLGAVEAAACGTPVVATRNSPLPRLLTGGGLFIDPRRPGELRIAVAELLEDEHRWQEMSRVALEQARKLTWEYAAGQFLELLAAIEEVHEYSHLW
ncbi:MAG: glycosyltransferase family 4 protein [Chloroflexi bacterium]|nr:glycosyltransferase family 4 protein [Chloroflexota bacterium]MCI0578384.1 glycosyltransferase family 4 protein [Chloroflexota bacterium]MCI0647619.1 glycosyltransferase family 4 protein [Chloroflexota bacterium]MCI0730412.1 glycosyltransferase family 4 protein [Chloroflexota bacterium]